MNAPNGLIAVAAIALSAISFSASAAESGGCPTLPANSGIRWVHANLRMSPIMPDPNWCDAEDVESGKILFAVHYAADPRGYGGNAAIRGGGHGRVDGTGVVAGRPVTWRTPTSGVYTSRSNPIVGPFRYWAASVPLRNGVVMQVDVLNANVASRRKALDVLARIGFRGKIERRLPAPQPDAQ